MVSGRAVNVACLWMCGRPHCGCGSALFVACMREDGMAVNIVDVW